MMQTITIVIHRAAESAPPSTVLRWGAATQQKGATQLVFEQYSKVLIPPFHDSDPDKGQVMRANASFVPRFLAAALIAATAGCGGGAQENVATEARVKQLEDELARLEAAVVESEDISAVKRLMRTYGYYVDKGLWEDLAALFTEDAIANYPSGVFVGRPSIRAHYLQNLGGGRIGRNDGELSEYMILQPLVNIEPDGKTAKGRWRALAMLGRYGASATWAEGPYEVVYAKDNGVWKIKVLNYYGTFTSPYEDGAWGKKREAAAPPARTLPHPPDRPRDQKACPQYPGACVPPFHYKNPVSGRDPGDLT